MNLIEKIRDILLNIGWNNQKKLITIVITKFISTRHSEIVMRKKIINQAILAWNLKNLKSSKLDNIFECLKINICVTFALICTFDVSSYLKFNKNVMKNSLFKHKESCPFLYIVFFLPANFWGNSLKMGFNNWLNKSMWNGSTNC